MEAPRFDAQQLAEQERLKNELRNRAKTGESRVSLTGGDFLSLASAFGVEIPEGTKQLLEGGVCLLLDGSGYSRITTRELGDETRDFISFFTAVSTNAEKGKNN